jgi:hypothetical protein
LTPSLARIQHPRPVHRPTRAAQSPERVLQRPVPVGAAEPPRRSRPAPFFGREPVRGEPHTPSLHFSCQGHRQSRRIPVSPPPLGSRDPIAWPHFFPGSNPRTEGISVRH